MYTMAQSLGSRVEEYSRLFQFMVTLIMMIRLCHGELHGIKVQQLLLFGKKTICQSATTPIVWEDTLHSMGTAIYFCLQNSDEIPFISSLDLRQLKSNRVVDFFKEGDGSFLSNNIVRLNVGATTDSPTIRNVSHNYIKSLVQTPLVQSYSNMSAFIRLTTLDISYNNLTTSTSSLNDYVARNLWSLQSLNASYNNVTGEMSDAVDPSTLFRLCTLLGGNPFCNLGESYNYASTKTYFCRFEVNQSTSATSLKGTDPKIDYYLLVIIAILGILGFFSIIGWLAMILFGVKLIRRHLKKVQAFQHIQLEFEKALEERQVQPPFYSYSDLKLATNDFHDDNKLGFGTFGAVYKGVLPDGTTIAVKRLFNAQQQKQVLNEFLNEVVLINGIKHKNLIQLKGCCIKENKRILVYEYAEKGNLAQALLGENTSTALNWQQRFNICVGIARGLCYLHEELQPRIIHRDIKPPNVLLDRHLNAKIADFGLAKSFSEEETHAEYTHVAGTRGYFAPEYASQGQLTEKADVFSFGILLLEIVSGRKCIDSNLPSEKMYLKFWAENLQKDEKLLELVQPEFKETFPHEEVLKVIRIALNCIHTDPNSRATMSEVVTMLLGSSSSLPELLYRPTNQELYFNSVLDSTDRSSAFRQSSSAISNNTIEIDERSLLDEEMMELELTEFSGRYSR